MPIVSRYTYYTIPAVATQVEVKVTLRLMVSQSVSLSVEPHIIV
jgi:hypothetical protein